MGKNGMEGLLAQGLATSKAKMPSALTYNQPFAAEQPDFVINSSHF
jgi:hypothetical protein